MTTTPPSQPPVGWTRISSTVMYDEPRAAMEWLAKAFGFEPRVCVTDGDGRVVHAEMTFMGAVIGIGTSSPERKLVSPRSLGGMSTQSLALFVPDVEAHFARTRAAGARITYELENKEYGDRSYGAVDPEGHSWWFAQRVDQAAWDRATDPYRLDR